MRKQDIIEDFEIELPRLMKFYDVETKDELIMIQARQIERLQKRLHDLQPAMPIHTKVRGA